MYIDMKKKVIITYDKKDIEMLDPKKCSMLPINPCSVCPNREGCCGCPASGMYEKAWKPYKDRGIDEMARNIRLYMDYKIRIKKLEDKMSELEFSIPSRFLPENDKEMITRGEAKMFSQMLENELASWGENDEMKNTLEDILKKLKTVEDE